MADPLLDAVVRDDVRWIAGYLTGRWMIAVQEDWVTSWLERLNVMIASQAEYAKQNNVRVPRLQDQWTGGSLDLYFRARMTEGNHYDRAVGSQVPPEIRLPVELHIGFVGIPETEEMLELLRRPDNTPTKRGPATPGIERTQVKVEPIDRVAARVSGKHVSEE